MRFRKNLWKIFTIVLLCFYFTSFSTIFANSIEDMEFLNNKIKTKESEILSKNYHFTGLRLEDRQRGYPIHRFAIDKKKIIFNVIYPNGSTKNISYKIDEKSLQEESEDFRLKLDSNTYLYFRNPELAKSFSEDLIKLVVYHKLKKAVLTQITDDTLNQMRMTNSEISKYPHLIFFIIQKMIPEKVRHELSELNIEEMIATYNEKLENRHDFQISKVIEENYFEEFDIFARDFLAYLEERPQLIQDLEIIDLVNIIKKITTFSLTEEDIAASYEKLLALNNSTTTKYLTKKNIAQNDWLMTIMRSGDLTEEEFLQFLQRENDLLFLTVMRSNFEEKSKFFPIFRQKIDKDLNEMLAILSRLRIFFVFKIFQKLTPTWKEEIETLLDEKKALENKARNRDFDYYGRFSQAGGTLADHLKLESKLEKKEWVQSKLLYDKKVNEALNLFRSRSLKSLRAIFKELKNDKENPGIFDILLNLNPDFSQIKSKDSCINRLLKADRLWLNTASSTLSL